MIIFLVIFLALLLIKWKLNIVVEVKNTESFVEMKALFVDWKRVGKFVLKNKQEQKEEKAKKYKEQKRKNEFLKNGVGKNKNMEKKKKSFFIGAWFFQNIHYDKVQIFETIGALDPFATSMALPIVATITTVPLQFFHVNYQNFQYQIKPEYNQFGFTFQLNAKASFRILALIHRIIKRKIAQIMF